MQSSRLEAFSDGVLAIIITIMVLELRLPDKEHTLHAFLDTTGVSLLTYLLSFVYVGIYWNNHHHLFQVSGRVNGVVLWANLHLLFWLSLLPLSNNWMDETGLEPVPTAFYGINLIGAAVAYFLLQTALRRLDGHEHFDEIFGNDLKGKLSPVLYLAGVGLSFVEPWIGVIPYAVVALLWLVPDPRVERWLEQKETSKKEAE